MTEELFPIVNAEGIVIGKATRKECHNGSMLLHPVVHLHVIGNDGSIYLQKRSMNKDIQPGKWDTAVGGHVDYGEEIFDALLREASEELGINGIFPVKLISYEFQSSCERELVNTYYIRVDSDKFTPKVDYVEIDEARFWSRAEVEQAIGKGVLTPNFENEYRLISALIP